MPTVDVINTAGKKTGKIELDDAVFAAPVNEGLLWEVVRAQRAGWRKGTHKVKGRSEVRGGGKKPYRQKGTGRARQGTRRAPNHVGGGAVFGPTPRKYAQDTPKKVKAGALRSAVSLRLKEEKLIVLEDFNLDEIKTAVAKEILHKLVGRPDRPEKLRVLVCDDAANVNLVRSVRNLVRCKALPPNGLNVYDVLLHDHLIVTQESAKAIAERLRP